MFHYTSPQENTNHPSAERKPRFRPSIVFSTDEDGRPITYVVAETEGEQEELLSFLRSMARQPPNNLRRLEIDENYKKAKRGEGKKEVWPP